MGTVWNVCGKLVPKGRSKYLLFRQKLLLDLYKYSNVAALSIAYEIPDAYVGDVEFSTGFGGSYGAGEKIVKIFKEHACKYMDDGTEIHVKSWEDAGGCYGWVK